MSEISQKLIDIVVDNKDKDDNTILGLMIGSGEVMFNKARGALNTILVEQGLRMTKAQRDEKAAIILEDFGVTDETTAEDVSEQVEVLVDELDIKPAAARAYIRAIFEAEEIEMPKAARKTGGTRTSTPGFNGDAKLVTDYLIANKECTREEFNEFMESQGKAKTASGKDKTQRWWNVLVDLKIFAESYCD